jgi:hypothetical protein
VSDTYVGSETLPPEGYLTPRRYKVTYFCHRCESEFSRIGTTIPKSDPPCPKKKCREAVFREAVQKEAFNLAKMLDEQRPPGHIGENIQVKAIDATAEIVMHDHGMTDLKDNIREGETMAPPLPDGKQKLADNFFSGNALERAGIGSRQAQMLGRRAIAGAFRSTAINPAHVLGAKAGERAPIQTPVRVEKIG